MRSNNAKRKHERADVYGSLRCFMLKNFRLIYMIHHVNITMIVFKESDLNHLDSLIR